MVETSLNEQDLALLRGTDVAHFVTLNEDGSPHVAPLWIDADDAGNVLVNTAVGRRKDRNVRRDPRVALSITPQVDPYRWLSISGTVVSIETGAEAEAHIDALNRRYHDGEPWTPVPGSVRVIYRIRPDRVARSD
jgi:PPOX class probable F420-dependent enzyme